MFKTALAAIVLVAAATAPAHADEEPNSRYAGGCGLTSVAHPDDPTKRTGSLYSITLLHSDVFEDNPVTASVTCYLKIDEVVVETATFTGTGIVVGQKVIDYTEGTDELLVCEDVDYLSDDSPTDTACEPLTGTGSVVPRPIFGILRELICCYMGPENMICTTLQYIGGQGPDAPGILQVTSAGDILVADGRYWDCPPYGA